MLSVKKGAGFCVICPVCFLGNIQRKSSLALNYSCDEAAACSQCKTRAEKAAVLTVGHRWEREGN